jgi:HlyD family secretion protein
VLLPLAGYIQDTGASWVFVLYADGQSASRRDIRTGRRNNRFVEIQDGLSAGERVITSSRWRIFIFLLARDLVQQIIRARLF